MKTSKAFILAHTSLLDELRLPYRVERTRKHIKLHVLLQTGWWFLLTGSTPSDRRALNNSLALLRRKIRSAAAPTCVAA
ncbi:hypothetical protein LNAOJCKE_4841 [Methylorubrum aminovorans]|uniref:Uncharacterized protein n=3 Tax=Methylorubrum TaxID=2282523 RepID=A0AA40VF31_9HYPH|nr:MULTISPECIES: hypothetical protein [Methylorubrum]MBA8916066.1 hypothetical protein [Methylorubrum thiocyanatum]GJE67609.1 hypothetical protein LNAOJCKE_4841 [Methylorubrum aminovorans]GJE82222.1 hypothetical protein CJNNKLLH_3585 [Methylorubrum thiocyanatum]